MCLGRHPQVGPALFLDAAADLLQLSSAGKGVTAPKSQPLPSAKADTGPSAVSGNAAADLRAAVTDLLRTAMASAATQDAPTGCALLVALATAACDALGSAFPDPHHQQQQQQQHQGRQQQQQRLSTTHAEVALQAVSSSVASLRDPLMALAVLRPLLQLPAGQPAWLRLLTLDLCAAMVRATRSAQPVGAS